MIDWLANFLNNTFGWVLTLWEKHAVWIVLGLLGVIGYIFLRGG